jgi:hypothetical protein
VSAILNALKKLEDDSGTLRPWSMRIRTANTARRWKGVFLLMAILPVLGGLTLAGYFYYRIPLLFIYRLNPVADSVKVTGQNYLPPGPPKPQPVQSIREDDAPAIPPVIAAPVRKAAAAPEIKPARKIVPKPPSAQPAPAESADLQEPATPSKSAPPTDPLNPAVRVSPEEHLLPVFNDPAVALQAIAWSKDPGQRMAVVNGLILREGDSVEGVTITKIREDQVIIRKGEQTMKLVFQGR